MFDLIAAHLQALPLAVQLVGVMVLLAVADFAFAVIAHLKAGDFHMTLLGDWISTKGLPIVVVALLFGLDAALKIFPLGIGGTQIGAFGDIAALQAGSFILQEAASIMKNAKLFTAAPVDEPVPEE